MPNNHRYITVIVWYATIQFMNDRRKEDKDLANNENRTNSTDKVLEYIKSDCYRYHGRANMIMIIKFYLSDSTFRWQVAFRLCHAKGIIKYFGYAAWKLNRNKKNIQISHNMQVGYGLYIGHGGPIVINPSTIIGDNCNLSQFTTIGSNHGQAAYIGNNVYIGPHVCLVEDVHIGNNVTIGAGSVVTKDIPDNATAAGNYAKVLNYNDVGRYVNRRWETKLE